MLQRRFEENRPGTRLEGLVRELGFAETAVVFNVADPLSLVGRRAADFLSAYPGLEDTDLQAYLAYARGVLSSQRVYSTVA